MRRVVLVMLLAAIVAAAGCGSTGSPDGPVIVATTTQVADLTRNVVGETGTVTQLLPAGAEAHDFEPRPSDLNAMSDATAIVASGAGLDDWVGKLREGAGTDAPIIVASDGARLLVDNGVTDPHVWMDPRNAIVMVENIRDGLAAADPANAATYRRNAERYIGTLRRLDHDLVRQIATVPADRRRIATDHDAIGYLADRYGITIVGTAVPSLASGAEPSAREITRLVETLRREHVGVIFPEAGVNPEIARAIAQEADVTVGGTLYADSLGGPDTDASTYVAMMRYDMRTLIAGMNGG